MQSTLSLSDALSTKWDVVIIGAGPAGGFAAIKLADFGLKILLLDKSVHPRPKVCGACINPYGVSILQQEGLLTGLDSAIPLKQVSIFSGGKRISYKLKGGIAIDRAVLDSYLIQRAVEKGVSVLFGFSAKIQDPKNDKARITLAANEEKTSELCANIVVGAFGISGLRSLKENRSIVEPEFESYIGAGAISPNASHIPAATIFMALGQRGYVGGVLLADGSLDTAAAISPAFVRSAGGIKEAVSAILDEAQLSHILLSDLNWKGTPLLSRNGTIATERYFAVGDACGYVEPFTGEGITWALQSAELAAPIIARAAKNWDSAYITEWKKLYDQTLKRRKRLCSAIQMLLRTPACVRNVALSAARFGPVSQIAGRILGGAPLSWI